MSGTRKTAIVRSVAGNRRGNRESVCRTEFQRRCQFPQGDSIRRGRGLQPDRSGRRGGAAVTLGLSHLGGSTAPPHVYELRLYHVNEGKMDALIARFWRSHRRYFQATQHEERWFLASRRRAVFAEPLCLHPRAPKPGGCSEELGGIPGRPGMVEGEGRL